MVKAPPLEELDFIKLTQNHGKFCAALRVLGYKSTSQGIAEFAHHVGLCWLQLAIEHLQDAKAARSSGCNRSTYSRSYYAVYNASKAVRFLVTGSVSLNADDHKKASELPDDFPDVEKWANVIIGLYEHRLRADYDNWSSTASQHSMRIEEAVDLAEQFTNAAKQYLEGKLGITL